MVVRNRILKAKFCPDWEVKGGGGGDEEGQLFHNHIVDVVLAVAVEAGFNYSRTLL